MIRPASDSGVPATPWPTETEAIDDRLLGVHNTRHASPRHKCCDSAALRRSAWLERFDWVLDAPLGGDCGTPLVLSRRGGQPRSVFVKAGHLGQFYRHWLPSLQQPIALYVGNSDLPLSRYSDAAQQVLAHPMVHTLFCENRDLDIDDVVPMPVGMHPADILKIRPGLIQARQPGGDRQQKVFVPEGNLLKRVGHAAIEVPEQNPTVECLLDRCRVLPRPEDYASRLCRYNFVLLGWDRALDTPAIWEALVAGTLPIIRHSAVTAAYEGLPVVRIRSLDEISAASLSQWWRQLAPALSDQPYLGSAYWWARISHSIENNKGGAGNSACESFPEHYFRLSSVAWETWSRQCRVGRIRMRSSRVVICGLARDVAPLLDDTTARIESLGAMFSDYRAIIVENDSLDDTAQALRAWRKRNARVEVISETLSQPAWDNVDKPMRFNALAERRNRYLELACARHHDYDYVVVLDMDLPRGFSMDGIANTFGRDGWDAVASNGLFVRLKGKPGPAPMFYDAAAYMAKNGSQSNEEINALNFSKGEPLVPVVSAFGGLCVYRMPAFSCGARYNGSQCEHLAFHRAMASTGFGRIYLNPGQFALHSNWRDAS